MKDLSNRRKHGVAFEDATGAFYDSDGLLIIDPDSSEDEERFVLLGLCHQLNLLVVVHCYCDDDQEIRIISARKANPSERKQYSEARMQ